jgi:hypothetical protein
MGTYVSHKRRTVQSQKKVRDGTVHTWTHRHEIISFYVDKDSHTGNERMNGHCW